MVNGNGSAEVRAILKVAGKLASPDNTLFNRAQEAIGTFRLLDYANQRAAIDLLAAKLETAIREWNEVAKTFVRNGPQEGDTR
ncbi:hypothetical protein ES708_08618 [subsurface metagenome]